MFEQFGNIYSNILNLAGLMFCLFRYVAKPRRAWVYAIMFMLAGLLSNYYWGVYVLVMGGEYPNTSSLLAYFGWNASFLVPPTLQLHMMSDEERHFFSPLALIPIPLNIAQLLLYLQYGGYFNNIWQCVFATLTVCLGINSIVYYLKKKKTDEKAQFPYVPIACVAFIFLEYVMWTSSCFDWPSEWQNPYNYATIIDFLFYIFMPWSIYKTYGDIGLTSDDSTTARLQKVFRPIYVAVVLICCIGGYLLAVWMRDTLQAGIDQVADSDPYSVIAVMLFVISIIIVSFSITIVLVVSTLQKSAEGEKLMAAKLLAEHSNAAKSDFLANMSHEIRTPINAVLGMNEMILRDSLSARDDLPASSDRIRGIFSDICNYSGNIESAGNSLLSLINDILDFSKIEAGKLELVYDNYRLSSVLNDVSNMIAFKAKAKELKFTVDVEETMPDALYGDEVRVRQVITNLLNNAVKYTHQGSVRLSVSAEEHPSDTDDRMIDLVVTVRDTGIGIKREDIDKLFSKFERVDLKQNSTIEGTGLGLAITKSLLDKMEGSVTVDSIYGEGSVFTARIPQKVISDAAIGDFHDKFERSISSMSARTETFHAPDAHILIVDDTPMNLLVAKGLLKSTDIQIDTAESGDAAITLAGRNVYDIILMDQRMPGMDGVTAMHYIKNNVNGLNARTPFICLTADAVSGAKERYLSEGFDDYLSKPIDGAALEKALARYLPEGKIEIVSVKPVARPAGPQMMSGPIDRAAGIAFSGGDEDFYHEIQEEFVRDHARKAKLLEQYYEGEDWKNYAIVVHALKSTSKMIGAFGLSEMAARMEKAADEGDKSAIDKEQSAMLKLYEGVTNLIMAESPSRFAAEIAAEEGESDDDILEFGPEG